MRARICTVLLLTALLAVGEAAARRRQCVTSTYRRKLEASEDMPLDADVFALPLGKNAPQQVHISLGDQTGTAGTSRGSPTSSPGRSRRTRPSGSTASDTPCSTSRIARTPTTPGTATTMGTRSSPTPRGSPTDTTFQTTTSPSPRSPSHDD
jgi:hypothetical protein